MQLHVSMMSEYSDEDEDLLSFESRRALGRDPMNRKIIAKLQDDGRASYMQISRELGTSEATVRARVNQMTKARVLRVVGVPDPVALGYEGYALVAMKLAVSAKPRDVSERFEKQDEVTYILFGTGRHDLVIEIICGTHREMREFIFTHCYGHDDIAEVEPIMALALNKYLGLKWGAP